LTVLDLLGFGPSGWGASMLLAAGMTLLVAILGFAAGSMVGGLIAWAKLSGPLAVRLLADGYTTVLRGVPDLLVIYLFYFGGSAALTALGRAFGGSGFIGVPALATGALALGVVSGAYQAEVYRGAYLALPRGELEAARSVGMIAPQVMRYAIPGLGNVWQLVLKESALISVTGLVELLRQSQMGAGSTREPFPFYLAAAVLYLAITSGSTFVFGRLEARSLRGVRRA
jgi:octopine/nopaline transport system permease protein